MNQFSPELLKTLIGLSRSINSDYSDKNALLFRILRAAMRLVKCEQCSFIAYEPGLQRIKIVATLTGEAENTQEVELAADCAEHEVFVTEKPLSVYDAESDAYYSEHIGTRLSKTVSSVLCVPVFCGERLSAALELINKEYGMRFSDADIVLAESLASIAGNAIHFYEKNALQTSQILALRQNISLNSAGTARVHDFVAESPAIKDLMEIVKKAAVTNSSVLLTGESGVGKEFFAEQIYLNSRRSQMPFVRVNCASLSETLMESELFGHVKGAYTSADSAQKGRFELADGGTIFLDEVGDIPLALQPKLLRVIQDKQFERIGSSETVNVDVRIIAATNRNLAEMVRNGSFREDLFFRLNVLPIRIPPLRARKEDILPIARLFLRKYSFECGKSFTSFSAAAETELESYRWPGNVRELENAVARACIIGNPPIIQSADLRLYAGGEDTVAQNVAEPRIEELASIVASGAMSDRSLKAAQDVFKRAYVVKILEECSWNQTKASVVLGIQRTYVSRLMNELHIREKK